MVCVQSIFPETPTLEIEYMDEHAEKRLDTTYRFGKDDPSPDPKNIGTQKTGKGDSGTGHWIMNTESKPSRAVLVAMTTRGLRALSSQVQITTEETILNFIKETLIEFEPLLKKDLESH